MDTHQAAASFTGLLATASGITLSMLPELEAWLRVASLVIGCLVGLASLYAILRNKKHPHE
jgi:zinc transporter ZupT